MWQMALAIVASTWPYSTGIGVDCYGDAPMWLCSCLSLSNNHGLGKEDAEQNFTCGESHLTLCLDVFSGVSVSTCKSGTCGTLKGDTCKSSAVSLTKQKNLNLEFCIFIYSTYIWVKQWPVATIVTYFCSHQFFSSSTALYNF